MMEVVAGPVEQKPAETSRITRGSLAANRPPATASTGSDGTGSQRAETGRKLPENGWTASQEAGKVVNVIKTAVQ
jgi:hypothetical protein